MLKDVDWLVMVTYRVSWGYCVIGHLSNREARGIVERWELEARDWIPNVRVTVNERLGVCKGRIYCAYGILD
jgi:hypothetical protein